MIQPTPSSVPPPEASDAAMGLPPPILVRAQPGAPLGSDAVRVRPHGRIGGATGRTGAARVAIAHGAWARRAALRADDLAGLRLLADWDACVIGDRRVDELSTWRDLVDRDRLGEVQGAFALAWIDRQGQLCLARDAIGHRGLYYAGRRDGVIFASTIHAVLAASMAGRSCTCRPCRASCPAPTCPGDRRWPPASAKSCREILRFRARSPRRIHFSACRRSPIQPKCSTRTRCASACAVRWKRPSLALLPADPDAELVGATLSGGIDSSLVVARGTTATKAVADLRALVWSGVQNELPFSSLW